MPATAMLQQHDRECQVDKQKQFKQDTPAAVLVLCAPYRHRFTLQVIQFDSALQGAD